MAIKVLNEFLPRAENARLGGIKVGSTLQIDDSGTLQTNQASIGYITNCISQIPRNIKFTLSEGVLTLKAGSTIYIPNGFESDGTTRKFTTVTTLLDVVVNGYSTLQGYVVMNSDGTSPAFTAVSQTTAGSSATISNGNLWYDVPNNLVKRCNDGSTWTSGYSLPIAIITSDGTSSTTSGVSTVDHTFSGFGYMDTIVFSLPDIHGFIPYGISGDSTPASITLVTTTPLIYTPTNSLQTETLYLGVNTLIGTNKYYYDYVHNLNRDEYGSISQTLRTTVTYMLDNGKIKNFEQGIVPLTKFDEKTDVITSPMNTQYWLNGNKGRVFLNCTSDAGQYVGFTKYNSTNGKFVIGGYQTGMYVSYTDNATVDSNLNDTTKRVKLLDESGNASFPGEVAGITFTGTAYRTYWADLAENYVSDQRYPIGTLICFGGKKDITEATKEVNGVISEKPGLLLDKKLNGTPVALCGKVKVRVNGLVNTHDKLVLDKNGVARKRKWSDWFKKTIAIALENKTNVNESLILCVTQFKI